MKKIIVFLLLISSVSFAQNIAIRGLIKDAVSQEPVIAASIGVQNSGLGTISNEEGIFQLSTPQSAVVVVSCLGYKTLSIPVGEFRDDIKLIALEPAEEQLEEVIVTKIPLHEYLRDVFNTSKARFNKPILLHTYYREFVKSNGKHVKFSDGLLDYHLSGTTKKTKSDLIIKHNRSFLLISEDEDDGSGSYVSVQTGVSKSYGFDNFIESLLEKDRFQDFEFTLKSLKSKSGQELYAMSYVPNSNVERALPIGVITFDPKTKLIYEIEYHTSPAHMRFAKVMNFVVAKASILEIKYKVSYKMVNNNYLLSFSNHYGKVRIWNKKHEYLEECRSDLIVTDFEKGQPFDKKAVFKKKRLFDKPTSYTDKFWEKNNAIVLTQEEEKVIESLEKDAITIPETE